MRTKVEVAYELSDSLLKNISHFNNYSEVPKINTTASFVEVFNKYRMEDFKPLFLTIINAENNETIGILPLMYHDYRRKKIFPYRRIKFFGSTFSDFQDIYAKQEHRKIIINSSLDWLFSGVFKWQELTLDDLLPESNIIAPIKSYLLKNKVSNTLREGKYYYINLKPSFEEVLAGTSKSFVRKNIRLAKNRITKAGNWEIEYNPSLSAKKILDRCKPIHIERQSVLGRTSIFTNTLASKAYEAVIEDALKNGEFNTFWLKFEGEYIGYMLGFYKNNNFYWWNTAFLDKYKSFYPSRLLQYFVIEYMHKKNYSEFNFMRGESGYKDKWTKTTRINYRFRIYNNKNIYGKFLGLFDKNFN